MYKILAFILFMVGCSQIKAPEEFTYREVDGGVFSIATWQKITQPNTVYKFYIEGDGHAFNNHGQPTTNPTPKSTLVREMAFNDPYPNVIYVARPCQYIQNENCSQRHWTTARFAPEVVNAEFQVIKNIAGTSPVILVGFSGGAQIAGLIATAKPGLNVKKIVTIAGNLDHDAWTRYHHLPPLNESMNLESYRRSFLQINQCHFVGTDDEVIPPHLAEEFVGSSHSIIKVKGARHNSGWESAVKQIYNEK